MSTRYSRTLPGAAAAAITVVFWGSAFAGIRAGLHSYSPTHLALLRFLSASAALALIVARPGMRRPVIRDVPLVVLLGLLGFAFYNIALNIGEQSIPSGPAALLIQTLPIWTALAAIIFLGERLRTWGWVGIAVSFAGALVIALGKGSGITLSWGAGLILLASVSASAYNIIQKSMLDRYRPLEITTWAIWAGTLLLLPFAGGLVGEVRAAPTADTLAVVYLGVGPAALAYVTWAVVLSRLPASRASSILFVVPVIAFLVGWVWLGEAPTLEDLAGGILAMGGVALVNTLGRAKEE
ncbi:MAG: EamA family transporter [Spirochaetia bacterium]|jgi:drug/metabolite transporter (DMT)-like permease